jgi:hypothetical protein
MTKKSVLLFTALSLVLFSCTSKKKEAEKSSFFPVISFIKSQIAHVDTSLFAITRINYIDSLHSDTTFFKREEFRTLAKEFTELPDLTESKYQKLYKEDTLVDESLNSITFTYLPIHSEKEYIQRQEVHITLNGSEVRNIFIDVQKDTKDSSIQKKMLWHVDHSFRIVTTIQKPGKPETTSNMKVIWNDEDNQ